jgi:hypothetical protein
VNQHALPYGGIELARLYDDRGRVVSNIGGRPWASFGVVVRNASARAVLQSQQGRLAPDPLHPPLELTRSPRGAVRRATPYPSRPYAGSFDRLAARGRAESPEAAVDTTHRFRPQWIETSWKIEILKKARYTVDVLFPSWGRQASLAAVLHDGQQVTLAAPFRTRQRVHLRNVSYFYIAGEETGYVVVPRGRRRGTAHIVRPKAQAACPSPGPTLALEIARRAKFKRLALTVRIAPASSPEHAAQVAKRLR